MILDRSSSPQRLKRRRFTNVDPMEAEEAKAKLAAVKEKFGREIRVFETSPLSSSSNEESKTEEPDEFYDFTPEDYYRIMASKKEDKFLKTRKIREAEEAARRSRITKAVIRIRFPDNHTLEAVFNPSEKIQSLVDLLTKRLRCGNVADTTPPKKQIKDLSLDFYTAGFIPGAIVYFAYDIPIGDDAAAANSGPFLQDEIISLKGLELITQQAEPIYPAPEPVIPAPAPPVEERKSAEKKPVKPKWLKL
ncbi:Ubiquitin-related domain containing protein [Trema orientale]|uniref:Ubiquitin-related domain containing protein n=1 Tax=Trema orientale TaxID=63057 RepID=A0A2P5FBX0_TREOI|nr:Ubiquitin-related domain containing protein [Trema orientale]